MRIKYDVTLTDVGALTINILEGQTTARLRTDGTSTSRTIQFQQKTHTDDADFDAIVGVRTDDSATTIATQTTSIDETWEFDVAAMVSLKFNVSAVAGGNVILNVTVE